MSDPRQDEIGPSILFKNAVEKLAARGYGDLGNRLARLLTLVAEEAVARPSFARQLDTALSAREERRRDRDTGHRRSRSPRRRPAGVLDPFEVYQKGETELRTRLELLDIEQLKDIIAEHGMDRDKLAMKWKTAGRLIDRIVETVRGRASKGDVFRT